MSGRRGFLALVGGTLFSGGVLRQATAKPTLILPPALVHPDEAAGVYPLLAAEKTQMHAFIHVKGALPDDLFMDWLEGGLRLAKSATPGSRLHRALQAEGRA